MRLMNFWRPPIDPNFKNLSLRIKAFPLCFTSATMPPDLVAEMVDLTNIQFYKILQLPSIRPNIQYIIMRRSALLWWTWTNESWAIERVVDIILTTCALPTQKEIEAQNVGCPIAIYRRCSTESRNTFPKDCDIFSEIWRLLLFWVEFELQIGMLTMAGLNLGIHNEFQRTNNPMMAEMSP